MICNLPISVLSRRRLLIIVVRMYVSRSMASRLVFIACTSAIIPSISRHRRNNNDRSVYEALQEGQHPLTGQRAANFRRDLEAT